MTNHMTNDDLPHWLGPGDSLVVRDGLLVNERDPRHPWVGVSPSAPMLARFVNLHRRSDEAIRDYARKWGLLDLCEHGLPATHGPRVPATLGAPEAYGRMQDIPVHRHAWFDPERIAHWRYWSAQGAAILRLAGPVQREHVANIRGWDEAWEVLHQPMPWGPPAWLLDRARELHQMKPLLVPVGGGDPTRHPLYEAMPVFGARDLLARTLTQWLVLGGVSVTVRWTSRFPSYARTAPGLFGALGKELVRAIQDASAGTELCSGCGEEVMVRRRRAIVPLCQRCSASRAQARRRARRIADDPVGYRRAERERMAATRASRRPAN